MRHRASRAGLLAIALGAVLAGPVAATAPDRFREVIEDTWTQAECDGYDVVQFNVVTIDVTVFHDNDGNDVRAVTHADTVGVTRQVYPDGSTVDVATYRDRGGIFVESPADDTFMWTGIIDWYSLRDGTQLKNIGSQLLQVLSWDPFEAEWIRDVGPYTLDRDPCTW